jgi:hypothetical protein
VIAANLSVPEALVVVVTTGLATALVQGAITFADDALMPWLKYWRAGIGRRAWERRGKPIPPMTTQVRGQHSLLDGVVGLASSDLSQTTAQAEGSTRKEAAPSSRMMVVDGRHHLPLSSWRQSCPGHERGSEILKKLLVQCVIHGTGQRDRHCEVGQAALAVPA